MSFYDTFSSHLRRKQCKEWNSFGILAAIVYGLGGGKNWKGFESLPQTLIF